MASRSTDLPISDFDSAPLGSLQPRLRGLDREQVQILLDHERSHAARAAYITHLEQRLADLDAGAVPSQGGSGPAAPPAGSAAGGSAVSPQSAGPPVNPPSHGNPANPAQPRS